jgi:cytoskeleton protein RodZ
MSEGNASAGLGIGSALRAAREQQGLVLEDIARSTKVRADYLRALENEEFVRMGGDVYAKGFLKTYCVALGIEPESLLTIYRQQVQGSSSQLSGSLAQAPVAREPRGSMPAWVAWVAVGLIVLLGVAALANIVGGTSPEPASQPRPPTAVTPEPTPTPTPLSASPTPVAPAFDGVNLTLTFESDSWVRVIADGEKLYEQVVAEGMELSFEGLENVLVRFGNAGGVRVTLNGEDLGVVGQSGQVEERNYTADGAR